MTVRERFASDYGMELWQVNRLVGLADMAVADGERYHNGNPHPNAKDKRDKGECSDLWDADVATVAVKIADLARPYGFTAVEFTGLRPCLKRGDRFVEIPE